MILFKRLAKLFPDLVKEFTKASLLQVVNSRETPYADIEIGLAMFYQIGEVFNEYLNGAGDIYFDEVLVAIIESDISRHPHECVKLAYFDVMTRYSKLLIRFPESMQQTLSAFVDERGIRSDNSNVRTRAMFLFLKLVKSLQNNLHPYVEYLYQQLKEFLSIDAEPTEDFEGKLFLYEALGSMLANENIVPAVRTRVLEQVFQPITTQMDHIVTERLYMHDTIEKPTYTTMLARQIAVLSYISKSLGNKRNQEDRVKFKQILVENIVPVINTVPNNPIIEEKIMLYLHRMIAVLDDADVLEIYPGIVWRLFKAVVNEHTQLRDVLLLVNQMVAKYGQRIAPFMNELFIPLVESYSL